MGKLGLFEFAQMRVFHLDAADLKIKGVILCDRLKLSAMIPNLGCDEFFNSNQGGSKLGFRRGQFSVVISNRLTTKDLC